MNVFLQVVQGRPAGKALRFGPGQYFLGRGPECNVRFNTDWVSRQHCQLRVLPEEGGGGSGGGVFLRDLGSLNGTLVNGKLISGEVQLTEDDLVQVGPVVLRVRLEVAESAVLPPVVQQGEILKAEGHEGPPEPPTDRTARIPKLDEGEEVSER